MRVAGCIIVFIMISSFMIFPGVSPNSMPTIANYKESANSEYTTHDPIVIDSNDDFETQGWPGDGTFQSPYIIEGLEITGNICVDISKTTVNFEIRDCYLIASGSYGCGVALNELQNATIRNCIIDVLFCTGISIDYAFNCSILGNDIYSESSGGFGIYLDDLHTGELSDNSVTLDNGGIQLVRCTDVSILRNSVNGKHSAFGFSSSESLVIRNNTIYQGGFRFDGHPELYVTEVSNNFVNGLPLGYFVNIHNLEVDGSPYGQIIIAKSSDVKVIGGIFNNCERGVQVAWSTNCTLDGIRADYNSIGIELTESLNCRITNCIAVQNGYGIQLGRSDNCTVSMCNTAFSYRGIRVSSSSYCNITMCKIYSNICGIRILHGISTLDNSIGNRIWGNKMAWNEVNAEDDAPTTSWDDGASVGNSWSDYFGGTYNISGEGETADNFPTRLIDNEKPSINHPEDIYYEEGVQDYFITWNPNEEYPLWYDIMRNHHSERPWVGDSISYNVSDYVLGEYNDTEGNNLPYGVFNITIIVSDGAGNQAVDTVLIYSVLYSPNDNDTTTTPNLQEAIDVVVALLAISVGEIGVLVLVVYAMKRRKNS